MPSNQQHTPPVRLTIPVNRILNDYDGAAVEIARHHIHYDHGVTLMVNVLDEPRTVWLDRHDLERLEGAVHAARVWLHEH
jgi:hypothetical protein